MERKIKFRGKRIDTGKFAYGDLIHRNDGDVAIYTNLDTWAENQDDVDAYGDSFIVANSTVGQFTGLHDKNGNEIYEGDIMQYNSLIRPEKYYRYVIAWNPIDMAFGCASLEHAFLDCPDIVGGAQITESVIIGNIYDDPGLLNKSRRIGEKFNYGDVTLEVTENTNGKSCGDCYFLHNWCSESFDTRGKCSKRARDDKREVYFKEVKK